ncbi:unnamed protein product [Effrenium voratum]|uniref:Uncharacterized protein n=1 Tax=Effrenium voratum TaxID=2562239 RepID=A0AA36N8R0_9DINO|nr:unnamed protein product [Effrenium voratum]CAJ1454422.1 unnamed protein product [Effrenium voratum]
MAAGPLPACGFAVDASKKGAIPIKVESRAKGKKVTIISGVRGNAQSLVSALSSLLGTGGTVLGEAGRQMVQVQGSQHERVADALTQLGCLRGVAKAEAKPKKEVGVVSRNCAYDKFLRKDPGPKPLSELLQGEAYAPQCPPGAECFRWHGYWPYCRGCCQQNEDDIWEDGNLNYDPSLDKEYGSASGRACLLFPARPGSWAQLDELLRRLGMLAEVGEAAQTWGLRSGPNAVPNGATLAEYRRRAVAPGARLLEAEPKRKKEPKEPKEPRPRERTREFKPRPAPEPAKVGCFPCSVCGHKFGLYKTLKQHIKLAHDGVARPISHNPKAPPAVSTRPAPAPLGPGMPAPAPPAPQIAAWLEPRSPCPVCGVSFRMSELQRHAQSCEEAQAPLVPEPKTERPDTRRERSPEGKCPMCSKLVRNLQEHVPKCLDLPSQEAKPVQKPVAKPPPAKKVALCEDFSEGKFETCPICQECVSIPHLQGHVERCLVNADAAPEAWQSCPLCKEQFHPDAIEAHVQACLDESTTPEGSESERSDEEEAEPEDEDEDYNAREGDFVGQPVDLNGSLLVAALAAYSPKGPSQMDLMPGDPVLLLWEQPPEEGGYWAWGCKVRQDGGEHLAEQLGYVPLSHLKRKDSEQSPAPVRRRWGAGAREARAA